MSAEGTAKGSQRSLTTYNFSDRLLRDPGKRIVMNAVKGYFRTVPKTFLTPQETRVSVAALSIQLPEGALAMSGDVFKGIEIVGTSDQGFSHAIEVGVARARQTLHNLSWFVVTEQRGGLQQGRLEYQVTLRVYFKLDAAEQTDATGE